MFGLLTGWKTLAVALLTTLVGALQAFDWATFVTTETAGPVLTVLGLIMGLLRLITWTPIGLAAPK